MSALIRNEIKALFSFQSSNRKWQNALLAALCVGTPLLIGLYFDELQNGLFACLGGLVILYLPESGSITKRIMTILICSFGFMISFTFGLIFSFHPVVSIIAFTLFSLIVHWIILYYKTSKPGSFFFILIASMAICFPHNLHEIPLKTGLLGLGTMFSCILALLYTLYLSLSPQKNGFNIPSKDLTRNPFANGWEAIITGVFMGLALALGHLFNFQNPYWLPISCGAVMQGASLYHIWQRSFQRILGTFVGLGFCWLILSRITSPLSICVAIIVLQFIVELLVVRQYALAVVFITPMTIFLTEAANPLISNPDQLITLRFWEILIGSILGAIGGWLLHKEKIRFSTIRGMQKMGIGILKKVKH